MSAAVKRKLSGSTDGMPILVVATASPGTTIDAAIASTTAGTFDETWLWANNTSAADVLLTLEIGDGGAQIPVTIPSKAGLYPIRPGIPLQNAKIIKAFAATGSVIYIDGFKNSITD